MAHPQVIKKLSLKCEKLPDSSLLDLIFRDQKQRLTGAELKKKFATNTGMYGLEEYRLQKIKEMLECVENARILYIIFDTRSHEWLSANFARLLTYDYRITDGPTWYGGIKVIKPICYWPIQLWKVFV